jgi:hypothetical protein
LPADGFTSLVASPLLIPHVRSPGGAGGRRVHAGLDADRAFAVLVHDGRRPGSPVAYGSEAAAAQAFNAEVERARRAGLTSRPEPVALSGRALREARAAHEAAGTG